MGGKKRRSPTEGSSNRRQGIAEDNVTVRTRNSLAWLQTHAPQLHSSLADANEESLQVLEDAVGPLPDAFRGFYEIHDGQRSEDFDFVPYHYLAGCREILATWLDQQSYDSFEWKKGWIPFARFDCDYLCINLESDAQNRGEVMQFFLKFPGQDVIATNFNTFLDKQREYLTSGVFSQIEEGVDYTPMLDLSWTANWTLDLLLQAGDTNAAIEMLSRLVERAPRTKKQLRKDARFKCLWEMEKFVMLSQE